MPEMEANQPIHEHPYGAYAGSNEFQRERYETSYRVMDDHFVEAVAQRVTLLMSQQAAGKIQAPKHQEKPPPGMQLALGIISVIALLPLAGICLGGMGGIEGIISFVVGCIAIALINLVFNGTAVYLHH